MRALILTSALVFCAPAFSEGNGFFQETLNKLTNRSSQNCWFCASAHDPEADPKWKQCLKKACPSYESQLDYALRNIRSLPNFPEILKARQELIEALNDKTEDRRRENQFLAKALQENMVIEDVTARVFMNYKSLVKRLGDFSADANGRIDEPKSRESFFKSGGTEAEFQGAKILMEAFIAARATAAKNLDWLEEENLRKMPAEELKSRLVKFLDDDEKASRRLSESTGLPLEFALETRANNEIRSQILSGKLQPSRLEDLKDSWTGQKFMEIMFEPKNVKILADEPKPLKDLVSADKIKTMTAENAAVPGILRQDDNFAQTPMGKRYDDVRANCLGNLGITYFNSPTKQQVDDFAKYEPELRKQYVDGMSKVLSQSSAKALSEAAAKWHLKLPESRANVMDTFRDQIRNVKEALRIHEVEKTATSKSKQIISVFLADREDLSDPEKYYDDFSDFCSPKWPSVLGSHAIMGKDELYIASPQVARPDTLKTNAFHEYSHLASQMIANGKEISEETKAWYKAVRECLNEQRHGKPLHEEEDFAEAVESYLAPNDLFYVCAIDVDKFTEKDFNIEDNSYDPDHSGAIYYFMSKLAMSPGGLPPVCREAFAEKGENNLPENCFAKVKSPASTTR